MKKFLILFLALGALNAPAASSLPSALRTDGKTVVAAFGDVEKIARSCTVQIIYGTGYKVAIGTLVNDEGLVVTKHSELDTAKAGGALRISMPGAKRYNRGKLVAYDSATDLAFIATDLTRKPDYTWAETDKIAPATWVVAGVAGSDTRPYVRAGITSATARAIPKTGAVIGILMGTEVSEKKGVPVREVTPKGPSEKAEELKKAVGKHDAGETITVVVQRKQEQKTLKITLGYRELVFASMKSRNDKLSGKVSVRRTGFEKVIQHEVTLAPSEMGGPLLDLKGRLLGINIARRNRVEFFALPASLVQKVIKAKAAEIAKASASKDKAE
jgi:serine protease Do